MIYKLYNKQGFSLVEMAIVLLIAGLLIAGAFQLMNSMQQNRQDQATANEMRMVVTAMERFINDQQGSLTYVGGPLASQNSPALLDNTLRLNGTGPQALNFFRDNYLPVGFNITPYAIGMRRMTNVAGSGSAKPVLKALVLRNPDNTLTENRRSKIAALIGSQGGTVLQMNAAGPLIVMGTQGSWQITTPAQYGITTLNERQLAAYTTTVDAQMNTNILSRIDTGNSEANTMRTDVLMNTDTNRIPSVVRGALGLGLLQTTARLGDRCDQGSFNVTPITNFSDGTTGAAYGLTINSGPPAANRIHPARLKNALVYGVNASGDLTILQCRLVAGVWNWQSAFPVAGATTWRGFTPQAASCPGTGNANDFCEVNNRGYTISVSQPCNDSSASVRIETVKGSGACLTDAGNAGCRELSNYYRANGAASGSVYAEIPDGYSYRVTRGCGGHLTWILE